MGDIIEKIDAAAAGNPYTGSGTDVSQTNGQIPVIGAPITLQHSLDSNPIFASPINLNESCDNDSGKGNGYSEK